MFGFVAPSSSLPEERMNRYKQWYCGICHSLRERHGQVSRLVLSYDMTFLAILLSSLYEPEEHESKKRCAVHPAKPRPYVQSRFSDYAADMNVALAWFKLKDDSSDDGSIASSAASRLLKKAFERVKNQYPRQTGVLERCMGELEALEKEGCTEPDKMTNIFGTLLGEVFVPEEDDHWAGVLRNMGAALGRYIYILDAFLDHDEDMKKGRYNPLSARGTGDSKLLLTMLIGDCSAEYEKLPLINDTDIMNDIIYSGVWQQFYKGKENADA